MEIVVVPSIGRIVSIRPDGKDNLLQSNPEPVEIAVGKDATNTWCNAGGHWLWPVARSRWPDISGSNWPPPDVLADEPWIVNGWRHADGTVYCLMIRDYGDPLNISVSRLVRLDQQAPEMTIQQKIMRTAPSEIPVSLCSISHIADANSIFMPIDSDSLFTNGIKSLLFAPPGDEHITDCGSVKVYSTDIAGEHKLGSDSRHAWIAARKDNTLIVERTVGNPEGPYPNGGCTVQMHASVGLGYTEIETLSPEIILQPGDSLRNTLMIECYEFPTHLPAAEAASEVRKILRDDIN